MAILNGEKNDDFLNKEWRIDDYTSLLECCLQDIEEEKSEIYGKLLKGLVNNSTLSKEIRKRMIMLVKELSINDILLLRKFYIYSKFKINEKKYIDNIKGLFDSKNHQDKLSKNKLAYFSLIDIDNDYVDEFIFLLLETIFDKNELTPENIGLKEWRNIKICIISYRLNDSLHTEIAMEAERLCYLERVSSIIIALIRKTDISIRYMYNVGILILDDQGINEEYIELLNQFAERCQLFIFKIGDKNNECIHKINYKNIFNLNFPYNLQSILSEIIDICSNSNNTTN
jgi:hypothetical protein